MEQPSNAANIEQGSVAPGGDRQTQSRPSLPTALSKLFAFLLLVIGGALAALGQILVGKALRDELDSPWWVGGKVIFWVGVALGSFACSLFAKRTLSRSREDRKGRESN
jgi:hypothetical protein